MAVPAVFSTERLQSGPIDARPCLGKFKGVVALLKADGNVDVDRRSINLWEDELGRFRIWIANIGAHRQDALSLNYRLRDDTKIRSRLSDLLFQLRQLLQETLRLLVNGENEVSDPEDETFSDDTEPPVRRQHGFVTRLIDCLFEMSMLIRRPAQSDFLHGGCSSEAKAFEKFDLDTIQTKYPEASQTLKARLVRSMFQRRRYLMYRERHHAKISRELDEEADEVRDDMSDTIATTFRPQVPLEDDNESIVAMTETTYSTSVLNGDIGLPRRPNEENDEAPFECHYCFCIITAPSRLQWLKHVFEDIKPYVCVFEQCQTPHRLYSARREWIHHIEKTHATQYEALDICHLCTAVTGSKRKWISHVAKHLQELAISALRLRQEEIEEDVAPNKSQNALEDAVSSEDEMTFKPTKERVPDIDVQEREGNHQRHPPRPIGSYVQLEWTKWDIIQFHLNVKKLGTDWEAMRSTIPTKAPRLCKKLYLQEGWKGNYGKTLRQIANQADTFAGRQTEGPPVKTGWWLCPRPHCDDVWGTQDKLQSHIEASHRDEDLDLFRLDTATGVLIYGDEDPIAAFEAARKSALQQAQLAERAPVLSNSTNRDYSGIEWYFRPHPGLGGVPAHPAPPLPPGAPQPPPYRSLLSSLTTPQDRPEQRRWKTNPILYDDFDRRPRYLPSFGDPFRINPNRPAKPPKLGPPPKPPKPSALSSSSKTTLPVPSREPEWQFDDFRKTTTISRRDVNRKALDREALDYDWMPNEAVVHHMLGDADRDMLKHLTSVSREARGRQKDEVTDDEGEEESGVKSKPSDKVVEAVQVLDANRMFDPNISDNTSQFEDVGYKVGEPVFVRGVAGREVLTLKEKFGNGRWLCNRDATGKMRIVKEADMSIFMQLSKSEKDDNARK